MKLLLASILATILSLLIGIAASTVIPYRVEPDRPSSLPPGNLTLADVEKARIETDKRAQELKKRSTAQIFLLSRQSGLWITWLPWVLVPLFIPVRRVVQGIAVLLLPSVATALGLFMHLELMLFTASLIFGSVLRHKAICRKLDDEERPGTDPT